MLNGKEDAAVSSVPSISTPAPAPPVGSPTAMASTIEYPIIFSREDRTASGIGLFNVLQWLLPMFQLAGWLPKAAGRDDYGRDGVPAVGDESRDPCVVRNLIQLFQPFFTMESRVVPNGAMLCVVQSFRYPTPRGPRTISRALVEMPNKYFSPLPPAKGGGHFLCHYEDRELLRRFTYLELDQLRFAWVGAKELVAEHKAVNQSDGTLTGLAVRDIRKNNKPFDRDSGDNESTAQSTNNSAAKINSRGNNKSDHGGAVEAAAAPPPVVKRKHPSNNVITGPSQEVRRAKEEQKEKKFMSELLRDECAARWPHTPVHKSVIFSLEMQQAATVGGRPGRKGPCMYLATVELPLLNGKKGGVASFKAAQWCTTKKDAENAAAEVALRMLRTVKM